MRAWRSIPWLLVALALAVYSAALPNDFIYDDHEVVQAHPGPRSATEAARIFREPHFPNLPYYRPITRATLLLQKTLHGEDPAPFHIVNSALAGLAAALAFWLLRTPAFGLTAARAAFASGLFLLHPIASSCVYPISSGRETLMPAVWMLAGMGCWLRAGWRFKAAAWGAFALALFSKEQAVVLPALFALADGLRLTADAPGKRPGRWAARYVPLLAIAAAYFAVRHALFGGTEYVFGSLAGPLITALYGIQMAWTPFVGLHYEPGLRVWFSPARLAAALAITALVVWRHGLGRTFWFWCGWFLIAPLPSANLLKQEAAFDERYVFLASLGLFALAAGALPARREAVAGALAILVTAAAISVHRARYFRDDFAFSEQWLSTDPSSVNAEYNLGFSFARRGEHDAAVRHYRRTLVLRPDYAYAHNNLGNALVELGRHAEALPHFSEAARMDPRYFEAWYNAGLALCRAGDFEAGARALGRAVELKPESAPAWINLGNALAARERMGEAAEAYVRALAIAPDSAEAHGNYANVLAHTGKLDAAVGHYREALRLDPAFADARRNLELVLAAAGQTAR